MKRYLIFIILILSFGFFFTACSSHKAISNELKTYKPPLIYHAAKLELKKQLLPEDKDLESQKEKIRQLKEIWEKSINTPEKDTSFYIPNQKKINSLSDGFSLETLEIMAWEKSPMIKNAQKNFRAALESYSQAENLNDILRQFSAFNSSIMTGVGNVEDMESIYKKFPFPGILSLKSDIVTQEVKLAKQDLEIAVRSAITEARKIYWDFNYNISAKKTIKDTLNFLNNLESSSIKRYETGQATIQELTKIQIQKGKVEQELITIDGEGRNIDTRLRTLLLIPFSIKVGTPSKTEPKKEIPSINELKTIALKHRQEVNKIKTMIHRMELMIEMAETEIYPGFTQNYSLIDNMEESFKTKISAEMGAGLPKMPWSGLNEAYLRETKQRLEALKSELKGAEAETETKVYEAWFAFDQTKRELSLYQGKIVELSKLNLKISSKAYDSGSIGFQETIDSTMLLLENRLSVEKRKSDLGKSIALLEEVIGISR